MIPAILAVHIIVCITLVIVVLLQQGKGAEIGAVFGGSSSTTFGSSGAGNMLTKITWVCAAIFFATSITLAYASTRRVTGSIFEGRALPSRTTPAPNASHPAVLPPSGEPLSAKPAPPGMAPGETHTTPKNK
jgi:preprotein translocase subunit SecG